MRTSHTQAHNNTGTTMVVLVTARKRSLGQGNIFRSVCQEFCSQGAGVCLIACRDITPPGAVHAGKYGQEAGGTHPTGMQSCF